MLNQFEKESKIIELHKQGKTIREIAQEVHKSFRDISKIIKKHEKQFQNNSSAYTKINDNKPVKEPKRTTAYKMFLNKKSPVEVAIETKCSFVMARRYWGEYLEMRKDNEFFIAYINNQDNMKEVLIIFRYLNSIGANFSNIKKTLLQIHDLSKLDEYLEQLREKIKKSNEELEHIINAYNMFSQPDQKNYLYYPNQMQYPPNQIRYY